MLKLWHLLKVVKTIINSNITYMNLSIWKLHYSLKCSRLTFNIPQFIPYLKEKRWNIISEIYLISITQNFPRDYHLNNNNLNKNGIKNIIPESGQWQKYYHDKFMFIVILGMKCKYCKYYKPWIKKEAWISHGNLMFG